MNKRKIGIVGFGHLGRYLVEQLLSSETCELCFVWNRTASALTGNVADRYILEDLKEFDQCGADLIVEVAHPVITEEYGERFLQCADFMIGSPTVLANNHLNNKLRSAAVKHGLYIPAGALWGGEDIRKMADRGILKAVKVTMTFHPDSFRLLGELDMKNKEVKDKKTVLYDGDVRQLCALAPNNTNTMAAASLAAHTLGFDKVQGCLIADPELVDYHIVEIEVSGILSQSEKEFYVHTVRKNPANVGHVTGLGTYNSFLSSVYGAKGKGPGLHLC